MERETTIGVPFSKSEKKYIKRLARARDNCFPGVLLRRIIGQYLSLNKETIEKEIQEHETKQSKLRKERKLQRKLHPPTPDPRRVAFEAMMARAINIIRNVQQQTGRRPLGPVFQAYFQKESGQQHMPGIPISKWEELLGKLESMEPAAIMKLLHEARVDQRGQRIMNFF